MELKIKPGKIRDPKELLQVLKKIKYLVLNGEVQFVPYGSEYWDFHQEMIIEGQWPDFFSNSYYDKRDQAVYNLICNTYQGNCRIKKEGGKENWIARLFGLFTKKT
ncbi:hypothetical protein [Persicobacter psychrovividus]|uniref:Uncharacterized protein n=1 Tax=Persicobacter psychrovividus TaxID=387638 RepID=A0ABN6LDS4_9BACT|nr:hypothetical protein PEPS_17520 [Persicobacter psychrovividus]